MKFVIDMNLSPDWIAAITKAGHEAVHWSAIGKEDASDEEVMAWAAANGRAVVTSDLDYGRILALAAASGPSVVQIRAGGLIPSRLEGRVVNAIAASQAALASGALLTIDIIRSRLHLLPTQSGQES